MKRLLSCFIASPLVRRAALALGACACVLALSPAFASATIHVPGDQPTIAAAIAVAVPSDVILVAPGTYVIGSTINAGIANLTIQGSGSGSTTLQVASAVGYAFSISGAGTVLRDFTIEKTDLPNQNLIYVAANGVTIRDNVIYGPDPGMTWSASGIVSRALEVAGGLTGLLVQGNSIHHLRQPAYVNPGTSGSIVNNVVSRTKGWVVDGAVLSFTGNTWGLPVNESAEIALLVSCSALDYPDLLALSAANGNAYISGQFAGASSGRATAYVDGSAAPGGFGNTAAPYQTVAAGVANALPGGTVQVAAGTYVEQVVVNGKNLSIHGAGRASTTIQSPATLTQFYTTSVNNYPVVLFENASDLRLADVTVDGAGQGGANYRFQGVGFWNAGGKVLDCDIVRVRETPFNGNQHGVGVYAFNNTGGPFAIEVGGCNLSDFQKNALALNGTGLTANVHDCTITGQGNTTLNAQNGVQIAFGAGGTVSNVSVSGIFYTPNTAAACALLAYAGGSVNVTNFSATSSMIGAYYEDMNGTVSGISFGGNTSGVPSLGVLAYNDLTSLANHAATPLKAPFRAASPFGEGETGDKAGGQRTASAPMVVDIGPGCLVGDGLAGSYGVEFYSSGAPLTCSATGLELSNWDDAFVTGGSNVTATAQHNSITGSLAYGYYSDPGNSNLATLNWWGAAGGPSGTNGVSGPVTASPWLTTGADANPGCGFTAGADNVISVGPAPSCISQANTCITIPVTIARTSSDQMRGYSVTVQLDPDLLLCSGPASIVQGSYLNSIAGTHFEVVDNLDNSYTVDCAILGATCGASAPTGTLFTLQVKKSGPDGTGTITLGPVVARDCDNAPVAVTPGAPLNITIDTASPPAPSALVASQLHTGNDLDGSTKVLLTFSAPPLTTVEVYRAGFGQYPEYDDAGGAVPATPSYPPPGAWTLTGVTASGQYDETTARDFWYYVAFAKDACGNVSAVSNKTTGTLNYHLGDVVDPGFPLAVGDNKVDGADISRLGAHYGITIVLNDTYNYLDVGPTTDYSVNARPTTDNKIGFEDLMMFAINYNVVSMPQFAQRPAAAEQDAIALDVPQLPAAGGTFAVSVRMKGAGDVQGASVRLAWDAAVVEPAGVEAGSLLQSQGRGSIALSSEPGSVDFALLGTGGGISGEGEAARVLFRVKGEGAPGITLASVVARDEQNQIVPLGRMASDAGVALPARTELGPVFPNPALHSASLQLSLAHESHVRVALYDLAGRRVRTIMEGVQPAGVRIVTWNGKNDSGVRMAPGVYVMRLEAAGVTQSRRLQFLP